MTQILEPATRPIWLAEHEICDDNFTSYSYVNISSKLGKITVKICDTCGYEDVQCLHVNNTVNTELITMDCTLCGG